MGITLSTAAVAGLEGLINTALRYDPATRLGLARLSGQVLAVEITSPAVTLYLTGDDQGVSLMTHWEGEVDTRLKGSLPALLKLARNPGGQLATGDVEVMGNTGLLMTMQGLLKNLDIDWEEALTGVLGDVFGHQAAGFLRGGARYAHDRAEEKRRLVSEFLTEELRSLPSRVELEDFYQSVDELRLRLDRLEARIVYRK